MSVEVLVTVADGVMELRLSRPERKNALSLAMYDTLSDALRRAASEDDVRAVVFSSEGDVFCAGNDLASFLDGSAFAEPSPVLGFLRTLAANTKPLVAAVQGAAVGIGTTLLLHCDYVLVGPAAALRMPFAQLGVVPEAGSSLLLPALVGHPRAFAWLVLGEWIKAEEAVAAGLANRIVDHDGLHAAAMTVARQIAALSPGAVQASRALLRKQLEPLLLPVIEAEAAAFKERLAAPDTIAAITAATSGRRR